MRGGRPAPKYEINMKDIIRKAKLMRVEKA